eukprot:NODE_571_length_5897_cov_0.529148.p1 type:complete len:356 gc:universal NODE_571_length_5897_cov_0.529148:1215-2282(+)
MHLNFNKSTAPKDHHLPNGKFKNPWASAGPPHAFKDILSMFKEIKFSEINNLPPSSETIPLVPVNFTKLNQISDKNGYSVTWLGHSCFLIIWNGVRILTDPVFSQRCSPFSFAGPKRYTQPPCKITDLKNIDLCLISHCHYDHLDQQTIKLIGNQCHYIVPLKTTKLLRQVGIEDANISEMDWFDNCEIEWQGKSLKVTCTPAQHSTARGIFDKDAYLWCSYVISAKDKNIFFAGDTGYRRVPRDVNGDKVLDYPCNPSFKQIGETFKQMDVCLLPIGAYSPKHFMSLVHVDPFDAACMFKDLNGIKFHPMHYGTFKLTIEPHHEPPKLAIESLQRLGIDTKVFDALKIGETREY